MGEPESSDPVRVREALESRRISVGGSDVQVIDDFVLDPDALRARALRAPYGEAGEKHGAGFPGFKSAWEPPAEVSSSILSLAGIPGRLNRSYFQFYPADLAERSRVHADPAVHAGVLFLNPGEGQPGTCFYRHRATGISSASAAEVDAIAQARGIPAAQLWGSLAPDAYDLAAWDVLAHVPSRFNRLILYPASLLHRNGGAWGASVEDARLVFALFIDWAAPF